MARTTAKKRHDHADVTRSRPRTLSTPDARLRPVMFCLWVLCFMLPLSAGLYTGFREKQTRRAGGERWPDQEVEPPQSGRQPDHFVGHGAA